MRKGMAVWLLAVTMALCSGRKPAQAQDSTPKAEAPKPTQAFRLDFSLNEFEDGKKINNRHYSINVNVPGESREVKIGSRVPVAVGSSESKNALVNTQYQYIDVGTNISSELTERGDELLLRVSSEISNLDADPNHEARFGPVVRQIKMSGSTVVIPGKPMVIGSVDDPASNRQFQLEVTVTKLK
jgi:hypothetical protein